MLLHLLQVVAFLLWTVMVLWAGIRYGRKVTQEDLGRPIPVTVHDEQTWLLTDRKSISLSQS